MVVNQGRTGTKSSCIKPVQIVAPYLNQGNIILNAESTTKEVAVKGGAPQGSALGRTLWNILYEELLLLDLPSDAN